jgi:hypothetical protein
VLDPDFTARVCAAGSVLPDCHVNVSEAGVGVNTAVCPKIETPANSAETSRRALTRGLSAVAGASVSDPETSAKIAL